MNPEEPPAGHIVSVHREKQLQDGSGDFSLAFRWGLLGPCDDCGEPLAGIFATREGEDRWCGVALVEEPATIEGLVLPALVQAQGILLAQDSVLFGVPWENVTVSTAAPRKIMELQFAVSQALPGRLRGLKIDNLAQIRAGIHERDVRKVLALLRVVNGYLRGCWDTNGPQILG